MNCLAIRLEVYASAFEVVDIPVGHTFIVGNIDYAFLRLYDPWSSSISLSIKRRQSFYILGLFWVSPLFQFNNPMNQPPSFWFGHHLKRFYFAFLKGQAAAVAAALLVKPELRVDENWNGNRTKPAGLQTFKRFCLFNRFLLSWDRFDKEYLRESWKLEKTRHRVGASAQLWHQPYLLNCREAGRWKKYLKVVFVQK